MLLRTRHSSIVFLTELTRSFQRFGIVFLVILPSIRTLDCVHLMVVVTRSLASEIVMIVATPVPPFSVVAIVAAVKILVVETPMTVVSSGGWPAPLTSS